MSTIKDLLPEPGKEQLVQTTLVWPCPSCKLENTLIVEVQSRYIEIFNYPFIPLGKELNVNCTNCGYQSSLKTLPDDLKELCTRILRSTKRPMQHYQALIYLIMFVSAFFVWRYFKEPDFVELLNNPKAGDIYVTSTGLSLTGYAMVVSVEPDFVYLAFFKDKPDSLLNMLSANKVLEIANAFTPYRKERLYQLYKEGIIMDVERRDLPYGVTMYPKKVEEYPKEVKAVSPSKIPERTEGKKAAPAAQ